MRTIKLSDAQKKALEEATQGPLRYSMCGWTAKGMRGFQKATVMKLDRLRLLSLQPVPGTSSSGQFIITDAGRAALFSGKVNAASMRPKI